MSRDTARKAFAIDIPHRVTECLLVSSRLLFVTTPTAYDPSMTHPCLHHHASPRRNTTSPFLAPCFHCCCLGPLIRWTFSFLPGTATPSGLIPSTAPNWPTSGPRTFFVVLHQGSRWNTFCRRIPTIASGGLGSGLCLYVLR